MTGQTRHVQQKKGKGGIIERDKRPRRQAEGTRPKGREKILKLPRLGGSKWDSKTHRKRPEEEDEQKRPQQKEKHKEKEEPKRRQRKSKTTRCLNREPTKQPHKQEKRINQ